MFAAILALLLLPVMDVSRSRGMQFRPLSKIAFFIFVANFLLLMQLGAKHVESPFIEFGQISTTIYFLYFIGVMYCVTLIENTLVNFSIRSSFIHLNDVKMSSFRYKIFNTNSVYKRWFSSSPRRNFNDPVVVGLVAGSWFAGFKTTVFALTSMYSVIMVTGYAFYMRWGGDIASIDTNFHAWLHDVKAMNHDLAAFLKNLDILCDKVYDLQDDFILMGSPSTSDLKELHDLLVLCRRIYAITDKVHYQYLSLCPDYIKELSDDHPVKQAFSGLFGVNSVTLADRKDELKTVIEFLEETFDAIIPNMILHVFD